MKRSAVVLYVHLAFEAGCAVLYIPNFFKILLNHSVYICTDPDQAMSEHLDKELVWNIQLLSQVHEHVTLCCGPVS